MKTDLSQKVKYNSTDCIIGLYFLLQFYFEMHTGSSFP